MKYRAQYCEGYKVGEKTLVNGLPDVVVRTKATLSASTSERSLTTLVAIALLLRPSRVPRFTHDEHMVSEFERVR